MHRNWKTAAGAFLIAAGLMAGSAGSTAHAAQKHDPAEFKQRLQEKVQEGKLTPGEAEVVEKLHDLRRSYHEKFRTDAAALIDKAVKDGKITKEQAERFKAPKKRRGPSGGPVMKEQEKDKKK